MIDLIVQMLKIDEFHKQSESIDIAKGKHKLVWTIKERSKQMKREKAWRSKK